MLKKIGHTIVNILLVIYVLTIIPLSVCGFIGIHPYAVTSGSMEPEIPTGSMVFSKGIPFEDLKKGDIVTFFINDEQTATHRITSIDKGNKKVTTKGDANNIEDPHQTSYENIIGKVILHIPYLGYIMVLLNTKGKIVVLAGIGLVLFSLCLLTEEDNSQKKKRR